MTNEEAIGAIESNKPTSGYTILCEALDLATSALREQAEREKLQSTCKACVGSLRDEKRSIRFCEHCGRRLEAQHE